MLITSSLLLGKKYLYLQLFGYCELKKYVSLYLQLRENSSKEKLCLQAAEIERPYDGQTANTL